MLWYRNGNEEEEILLYILDGFNLVFIEKGLKEGGHEGAYGHKPQLGGSIVGDDLLIMQYVKGMGHDTAVGGVATTKAIE